MSSILDLKRPTAPKITVLLFATLRNCSGPKRSIKITDHFTCTSANVIYCITCTLCKKLYIGETGRRLGDRFQEHLRDVEKDDKNASKPVARHFHLQNHSKQQFSVFYQGPKFYNSLSTEIVNSSSSFSFKKKHLRRFSVIPINSFHTNVFKY